MKKINESWILIILMLVFTTFSCSDDDKKETKFDVSKTSVTLEVEDSEQLSIIIKSSATSNNEIFWISEDEKIATVSDKGKVTAVAEGNTKITVTVNGVSAIIKVTVIAPVKITAIKVDKTELTLNIGANEPLSVTIEPTNASIKRVTWKSDDETIATVSAKGIVKAIAAGITTITASADGISAVTKVTVNELPIKVKEVRINETAVTLETGESKQLSVTIEPADASDKQVSWKSEHTDIATVSEEGLVTAVAAGIATITATVGGISAETVVTVITPFSIIGAYMGKVTAFEGDEEALLAENVLLTLVKASENTINISTEINLDGLSIPIAGELTVSKKEEYHVNGIIPVTVEALGAEVTATITGTINTEGDAKLKIDIDILTDDAYFMYEGKKK